MLHTTQVVLPHHFYRSYHFSERNSLVILRKRLLLNWSPLCKSISNKRPMSHVFYLKNNNQLNRVIHTKYLDNAVEKILYKKIINFFFLKMFLCLTLYWDLNTSGIMIWTNLNQHYLNELASSIVWTCFFTSLNFSGRMVFSSDF